MSLLNLKTLKTKPVSWFRWTLSRKGFWSRALLAWLIALVVLKFDEADFYDLRFKTRGDQLIHKDLVLVTLKPSDLQKISDSQTTGLINVNESTEVSDSFFWDQKTWTTLLTKILKQNPKKVGISIYFGENVGTVKLNSQELLIYKDPRLVWSTYTSRYENLALPFATKADRSNIAHTETLRDEDGLVRRLTHESDYILNLAEQLTQIKFDSQNSTPVVINFRGTERLPNYSLAEVLNGAIPSSAFKDKIVIIGASKSQTSLHVTPIGPLTQHELWAQVADNLLQKRFILKAPTIINAFLLLALMIVAVLIITQFPQSVSFFIYIWIALIWSATSLWIFDSLSVWIPLVSPIILLMLIWILYIGYQALLIEKAHSDLQQEQIYLSELEQLKNNFVSLISHDLKTPIAKIQGVLDRLSLDKNLPTTTLEDFESLKEYSEELNKYIQSILKVLRVESRDFKIIKETADLNGVIETVVERLQPLAETKNLQIQLNLEPMFLIEFDVTLMTEVVLNLVENAIKYTPVNGHVFVNSFETSSEIILEIKDSGEGISAEDQMHIFKKFVRGKNQELKTKGSGLGLYLVKYFIELHGGSISLESTVGQGTTFRVRLPIDADS